MPNPADPTPTATVSTPSGPLVSRQYQARERQSQVACQRTESSYRTPWLRRGYSSYRR